MMIHLFLRKAGQVYTRIYPVQTGEDFIPHFHVMYNLLAECLQLRFEMSGMYHKSFSRKFRFISCKVGEKATE